MKNNKKQFFGVLLIVLFVSYFAYNDKSNLKKDGVFVIGKVTKNTHGNGNDGLNFSFTYNKKVYNEWCFSEKEGVVGKSYFCIVNPKNIKKTILLVNCPVPESITISPDKGWKTIPVSSYKLVVDEYFKSNIERFWDSK